MAIRELDLSPWNDPDTLLEVMSRVPVEPQPHLLGAIARLLDHEDPDIREEALRILVTRWKDESFRRKAIAMLRFDPGTNVRSAAAYAIAGSSSAGSHWDDTILLVDRLVDSTEEVNVRGAAYDALLILHRKPAFPTKMRPFDPQADVDWEWIEKLPVPER